MEEAAAVEEAVEAVSGVGAASLPGSLQGASRNLPIGEPPVLLLVRDARTAVAVRQLLSYGARPLLEAASVYRGDPTRSDGASTRPPALVGHSRALGGPPLSLADAGGLPALEEVSRKCLGSV